MSKSIFITLEGVDGAGKSTHIDFIKNYFDISELTKIRQSFRKLVIFYKWYLEGEQK